MPTRLIFRVRLQMRCSIKFLTLHYLKNGRTRRVISIVHTVVILFRRRYSLVCNRALFKKRNMPEEGTARELTNLMQKSDVFSFVSYLAEANRAGAYLFIESSIPASSRFWRRFCLIKESPK